MKPIPSLARALLFFLAILGPLGSGPAEAAEPGAVTVVLAVEPESLDPGAVIGTVQGQIMNRNILEMLTERNPADSSVIPGLATSWEQVDETTWRFKLREGVKFHDGEDFNADAVVFSLQRLYEPTIVSDTRAKYFTSVQLEGKALDDYTVEIKSDKPEPLLPILMSFMPVVSPATPMTEWTRTPVGTGPYRFASWDPGTQITLERFDDYWGELPEVEKATYVWRRESAVRAAMVEIGEADIAPDIAVQDAGRPDLDKSYLNANTTLLRIGGISEPPLNDIRVRKALNYAINRDAIRGSILPKDVLPATQVVVPSTFGYNPDIEPWPYDPELAKQLLDEARADGVPVDTEIRVLSRIGHFPGSEELMEAVTGMLRDVGLTATLETMEAGVFRSAYVNKPHPEGVYLSPQSHDNASGDAAFSAFTNLHCEGSQSRICDPTLDDLIERAQVATGEERRRLWQEAFQRAYVEIVPEVMLFHIVAYCRVGERIDFTPSIATGAELQLAQITFK